MDNIYVFLGKLFFFIITSSGAALVLFKFYGQKCIENKFSKDLEEFKVKKLHEFDVLFSRKTKWNEKEYEVLQESWVKIIDAYHALKQAVALMRELPDLNRKTRDELDLFLAESDFSKSEKQLLLDAKNKNDNYVKILESRELQEAHKAFLCFHKYFEHNRIFLAPDIKEKFEKVDDYIWSAWVSRKMGMNRISRTKDFTIEAYNKIEEKIEPMIKEIEDFLQSKLFPETE